MYPFVYPTTDGQQTGNNFVDDNMLLVAGNMLLHNRQHVAEQHVALV